MNFIFISSNNQHIIFKNILKIVVHMFVTSTRIFYVAVLYGSFQMILVLLNIVYIYIYKESQLLALYYVFSKIFHIEYLKNT